MQINYLDWEVINADEMYKIADEANVPVIVIEPLRGGQLCNLPKKAQERLEEDFKKAVRLSENIIDEFKKYNIDYITLDLEGLRNGSMDI